MFTVDKRTRYIKCDEGYEVLVDFKSIKYKDSSARVIIYTEELIDPNVIEIFSNTIENIVDSGCGLKLDPEKAKLIIERICRTLDFAQLNYKITH